MPSDAKIFDKIVFNLNTNLCWNLKYEIEILTIIFPNLK